MVQVIWLKRDLRVYDHAPLAAACATGDVLPLYVVEPDYWALPDTSGRHYSFITECLTSLQNQLRQLGGELIIKTGDIVDVLAAIHAHTPITAIHSHEETGNAWTFARDIAVRRWCNMQGVQWHEYKNFGVERPLKTRDQWAALWENHMVAPRTLAPSAISMAEGFTTEDIPSAHKLGITQDNCPLRQIGGRDAGLAMLGSFLAGRGKNYQKEMSSPISATEACSRLSPHIAYGSLSLREIVQSAYAFRVELAETPREVREFNLRAIDAFIARLHWHCHFIQKLEDEPQIEHHTFHPAFENARINDSKDSNIWLEAWATGQTGWPFVDACMRSLIQTGWINFRMRAMLMAVASYHLWLDWRQSGQVLARYFTDYEPGIHWSQCQMQAGTTAINTLRIYNPIKQSKDQDPDGIFIRQWVPELANIPNEYIHEPWTMPPLLQAETGLRLGDTYPAPIRDHIEAAREARAKITEIRRTHGFRENQLQVLKKHGSRKNKSRNFPKQKRMIKKEVDTNQLKLDL